MHEAPRRVERGWRHEALTWLQGLDLVLVAAALCLSVLGGLLIWSATRGRLISDGDDPQAFLSKHVVNLAVGLLLAAVVSRLDLRVVRAFAPILYAGAVLLLVVVLTPLGSEFNGAQAWIALPGGFTLQPGEFAKPAVIVMMSVVFGDEAYNAIERAGIGGRAMSPRASSTVWALAIAGLPMALILLQPDLGTVMVLGCVVLAVLALAGVRGRWIAGLALLAVAAAGVALKAGVVDAYQIDRLVSFANPDLDPQGVGYNTQQARIAIGAGGLLGQGLFHGAQTQGQFVPYQQTDFVFSVAGEELGLLGSGLILVCLLVVLWRGLGIASAARSSFGLIAAGSVCAWFAFQSFENIGMNLGIMPVTGVPLPFVSYGGSSMFACWLGIGLLQAIHRDGRSTSMAARGASGQID